ncbi:uncharacterized protein B0P05DRAFT_527904 [Gilbertella persicaria]|uniref:uncharacterized protein n=1 Tax=Gilbertella persicaria TaxID=101096 RepID=UPI002220191B|nr:uncharacterized protein B0P05DRAFT_527904 [Gilbertella persicaria]KAI8090903.1 hypothetical protein B0P05DRAFT_527904 [Gilbertella persicaria]
MDVSSSFNSFSQLAQKTPQRTITNINNNNSKGQGAASGSVFSRLRGAKVNRTNNNIQNRLGKTVGGGINKKKANVEQKKSRVQVTNKKQPAKKQMPKTQKKKKPVTAEDLDRAMDSYMMKDPKTAQAKLDAELTSYMDEAGDILMEDNL